MCLCYDEGWAREVIVRHGKSFNVEKCVFVNDEGWAREVIVRHGKSFNVAHFLDTIDMINVNLCLMVLLTELLAVHTTYSDRYHISRSHEC